MDQESASRLAEIVAKEPAALSEADIAFLRARQSYLSGDQAEKFAGVIADAPAPKTSSRSKTEAAE